MLYSIVILICLSGTPRAACTVDTAYDVVPQDRPVSAAWCGLSGQTVIARTALPKPNTYVKVTCLPLERTKRNGL